MMLGTAILFLGVASYAGMAQSPGTFTATGAASATAGKQQAPVTTLEKEN